MDRETGQPERTLDAEARVVIAVAVDGFIARQGVLAVGDSAPGMRAVDLSAADGRLLETARAESAALVVMDTVGSSAERVGAAALAREIDEQGERLAVLVLAGELDLDDARALLAHGVAGRGYLAQARLRDHGHVIDTIESLVAGGSVVDSALLATLSQPPPRDEDRLLSLLTPLELHVLGRVASGQSNKAIADALVVTKRAVESHVNSIFRKLALTPDQEVNRRVTATLLFLRAAEAQSRSRRISDESSALQAEARQATKYSSDRRSQRRLPPN